MQPARYKEAWIFTQKDCLACVMIIAVDGTAASGKGTLAKALGLYFGFPHLETGLLYRAVGFAIHRMFADWPHDCDLDPVRLAEMRVAAASAARQLTLAALEDPSLRGEIAEAWSSRVAAWQDVREGLLAFQHNFITESRLHRGGAVLDGRDIGTAICPEADIKFFITAEVSERARRRHQDWCSLGRAITFEQVLSGLQERDQRDASRLISPLKPAHDAFSIDTTHLTPAQALQSALAHIAESSARHITLSPIDG